MPMLRADSDADAALPRRDPPAARRWGRVADVMEDGVIYLEDAERLILADAALPPDPDRYVEAHTYLSSLVADTIVFYAVRDTDDLGRLISEVWVGDVHVNDALRARGHAT